MNLLNNYCIKYIIVEIRVHIRIYSSYKDKLYTTRVVNNSIKFRDSCGTILLLLKGHFHKA